MTEMSSSDSGLILPDYLTKQKPAFGSTKEELQWMNGKPTRHEVQQMIMDNLKNYNQQYVEGTLTTIVNSVETFQEKVNGNIQKLAQGGLENFHRGTALGLQMITLLDLIDKAVGGGFKERFLEELNKAQEFLSFLNGFEPEGEHGSKAMKEKINIARSWNAREDYPKMSGMHFGLGEYITAHWSEFSPEEIEKLNEEFKMAIPLIPVAVTEQEPPTQTTEVSNDQE